MSVSRSGSPGPAPTMWAMPTGASRRRASSSSPSAVRRAPASSPASTRRAAGPSTRRRQKVRRRAGSTIRALTWARKVAASRARLPMRSGSAASMRPRRVAAERRRGAAGRDRHHDVVAIDDRRQDEIAERRPVGHVHRHAEGLGDPLGDRIVIEIAGGDEDRGRAAEIVDPDVRKLPYLGAGRARQTRRDGRRRAPRPPPRPCGLEDRRTAAGASQHGDPQQDVEAQHGGRLAGGEHPGPGSRDNGRKTGTYAGLPPDLLDLACLRTFAMT